jgi:hypothetical protein
MKFEKDWILSDNAFEANKPEVEQEINQCFSHITKIEFGDNVMIGKASFQSANLSHLSSLDLSKVILYLNDDTD